MQSDVLRTIEKPLQQAGSIRTLPESAIVPKSGIAALELIPNIIHRPDSA